MVHEKYHVGKSSARRRGAFRQPAAGRAHLSIGEVLVRRHERNLALSARRAGGIFLLAQLQSDAHAAAAFIERAAGQGRLPADRLGRGDHCSRLLALCKSGDHVLLFVESYGPTRYIVQHLLAKFAVTHTMLSIEDLSGIEHLLQAKPTRLVIFESPTNPVTKIADIEHLTRHARAAGRLTVLDNTFAGFHNHGALRHRYLPAQPDQVRLRARRCHGRRDHCAPRTYRGHAQGHWSDGPRTRSACRFPDSTRHAHLLSALRAAVRQCARSSPSS